MKTYSLVTLNQNLILDKIRFKKKIKNKLISQMISLYKNKWINPILHIQNKQEIAFCKNKIK